jgi:hypothetical protein
MTDPLYIPPPDDPDPTCSLCPARVGPDDWCGTVGEFFCPDCLESLLAQAQLETQPL